MARPDAIEFEIFKNLFVSIAEEMGETLCRTSFSPNIKERLDYSCAVYDANGETVAQGDHMPVHLGAMPLSVRAAIDHVAMAPGDSVVLNDTCRTSPWSPRCSSGARRSRRSTSPTVRITPMSAA
jgi:N-methylhydantoinase B/oxoprolinase/acetone carboxylase alpha subunit